MKSIGRSRVLTVLFSGSVLLSAGSLAAAENPKRAPGVDSYDAALAAFDTIQTVLQHPRCQNCHIPGDAPLQFDAGLVHNQNVQRGSNGLGAPGCSGATLPRTQHQPGRHEAT